MIYLVCFFASALFFWWSEKFLSKKKKAWYIIFCAIAIIIPAALAGLRDFSIGYDVQLYGNSWFHYAKISSSFYHYCRWTITSSIGVAYATLNYVVALFADSVRWFYFFLSLFTILFVYIGVSGFRDKISVPFAMLIYYLMFFNSSLNILRQSIAMAVLVIAYRYLVNKKYYLFFLMIMLAFMFHNSAFLMIVLYFIYKLSYGYYRKLYSLLLSIGMFVLLIAYPLVIKILVQIGFFSGRYLAYTESSFVGGRFIRIFFFGIFLMLTLLFRNKLERYDSRNKLLINCAILSFVFSILLFLGNNQAIRPAFYFDISLVITLPMIANQFSVSVDSRKGVKIMYPALTVLLLAYWFITIVMQNNGQTYPYVLGV